MVCRPPPALRLRVIEHRVAEAELEGDHRQRHAGVEDDARRLGVAPDVVLRRGRDIADHIRRAAHHVALLDAASETRLAQDRQRDIGQGAEGDERQCARLAQEALDQRIHGVLLFGVRWGSG